MAEGSWDDIALRLDGRTRRSAGGRTLLGGSPLRLVRLTDAGARVVADLATGAPVGPDPARRRLARRLLDSGLAHPVPLRAPAATVSIVVPVRDHAPDLRALLDALTPAGNVTEIVVVDDGSVDPATVAEAVAGRARLVRREVAGGPAAARNAGWRTTATELVAFLDADVLPRSGWLDTLRAHFTDPAVAAAAPRVRARRSGQAVLDRFEEHRSPLDLGPDAGRVAPGSRIPYVPTAAIVYRRDVLEACGGFDESLRFGEDVDLVWRAVGGSHTVRYEPAAEVSHRNRSSWTELARQRFRYGSAAAALDQRHPGAVPPVRVDGWSLLTWSLPVVAGRRGAAAGVAVGAGTTLALARKLRGRVDRPAVEALRLAGLGHLWAGRWLARATTRTWLPPAVVAAATSRRARRLLGVAVVAPALVEWWERRPDLDPVRWTAACALDDAAYCAGVWAGCLRAGSPRALVPRIEGLPGVTADG